MNATNWVQNHPELISLENLRLIEEFFKVPFKKRDIRSLLNQLGIENKERIMPVVKAHHNVWYLRHIMRRALMIKEMSLVPGSVVEIEAGKFSVKTIARDFYVHLEGKAGAFNPKHLRIV